MKHYILDPWQLSKNVSSTQMKNQRSKNRERVVWKGSRSNLQINKLDLTIEVAKECLRTFSLREGAVCFSLSVLFWTTAYSLYFTNNERTTKYIADTVRTYKS